MADKMDAAAPEHARRLLKDDPSTLTPADVRELQAMAEGCVQALGLIRAQTWRLLNALKVPHDTAFVDILKRAQELQGSIGERSTELLVGELMKRGWESYSFTANDGSLDRQGLVGPPYGQRDEHEKRTKNVRRMTISDLVTESVRRFEDAPPSSKIVSVLRFGIATGVAVERGDVEIEDFRQGDDSTSKG